MGGVCRCWISNLSRNDCTVTRRGSHTLSIFLFFLSRFLFHTLVHLGFSGQSCR
jgi:hypothetical protein